MQKKRKTRSHSKLRTAFSLVEAATALIILAIISSSVLVVINRCMASVADSALRMHAFEVARENMETLLSKDSVKEMVEYGSSNKYRQVQWQTTVETFYEPITARMWIQAICSAEYTDTEGNRQTVELTHWLTDLTKEQLLQLIQEKQKEKEVAEQIIETIQDAAMYAGVDELTIREWENNGMPRTENGKYTKGMLDLYKRTDGNPTAEEIRQQQEADRQLLLGVTADGRRGGEEQSGGDDTSNTADRPQQLDQIAEPDVQEDVRRICGYTMEELMPMGIDRIIEILLNCDEF